MKKGIFNRRIPTAAALITLIIIIAISTFLIQKSVFYVSHATPDTTPLNFSITNVSDTSFTAVFTTTLKANAVIVLKNNDVSNSLILDDRDKKNGAQNKYFSHHITVPNLKPNTTYSFALLVEGQTYSDPSYKATTGSPIAPPPPTQNPIFGKVVLTDNTPATDTIVTAQTSGSQLVSAITDSKGEFIIPTNSLRDSKNENYLTLENPLFTINAFRQNLSARVTSPFILAQNLPTITLSEQYSFTENTTPQPTGESQLTFSLPQASQNEVSITVPKENQTFVDLNPQFTGTSYPNSSVTIEISGGAKTSILANSSGYWSYRPDASLSQGSHTISANASDKTGRATKVERDFSIFPLGSQVAESATPSATPVITSSPTPTLTTPTPTLELTITPTIDLTLTPTASPTSTLTPTLIPTTFATPTSIPTIANPGGSKNSIILTSVSVILIVGGVILLFAL